MKSRKNDVFQRPTFPICKQQANKVKQAIPTTQAISKMASYKAINNAVAKLVDTSVFDAKKDVIDKLIAYLEENVEIGDDVKNHILEFKESIILVATKTTKKRAPNDYNKFMKTTMAELKEKDPSMDSTERMKQASKLYKEYKAKKAAEGASSEESESHDDISKGSDDEMTDNVEATEEEEVKEPPAKKGKGKKGKKADD